MAKKGKQTGKSGKAWKHQDRKLENIYHENIICTTKNMNKTRDEVGDNICDTTIRKRLNKIEFTYRKAKRKPKLT